MAEGAKKCWVNCCDLEDEKFLCDAERIAIDKMQDALEPLDDNTEKIRQLITRFEACYHQADKEAMLIIEAIASGRCPPESNVRPPERKKELQNSRDILFNWCEKNFHEDTNLKVGDISADELVSFLGEPTALKIWQLRRVVDKITSALDPDITYCNLALNIGDYGQPVENQADHVFKNSLNFLLQTRQAIIHDTIAGRKAEISLAMAIDLLMPCHWDFTGSLINILKAVNGVLQPAKPFTCCSRNLKLSPLCDRLEVISNTLRAWWRDIETPENPDGDILAVLGDKTPVKRWLAASLDKTIRLQLAGSFPTSLI